LAGFAVWDQVYQRVKAGEMPPKKEEQPAGEAKTDFLKQLKASLLTQDRAYLQACGRVHGRRLTRVEIDLKSALGD